MTEINCSICNKPMKGLKEEDRRPFINYAHLACLAKNKKEERK